MALIAPVISRLQTRVQTLRSVEGAQSFARLVETGALPQSTPAAHVVPVAMMGGAVSTGAGLYVQSTSETIGVIVTLRTNDQAGAAGVDPVEALKSDIIAAIAGWAPADEIGEFRLVSARTLRFAGGAIVYQIDFSIEDQLRIHA